MYFLPFYVIWVQSYTKFFTRASIMQEKMIFFVKMLKKFVSLRKMLYLCAIFLCACTRVHGIERRILTNFRRKKL